MLQVEVVRGGGNTLILVRSAHQTRKGLLVVGDGGALVVGGANAAVLEGVLGKALACALLFRSR